MSASGHILLVDDEAQLRRTLARVFQRAGFDVTTAAAGEEALRLLSQQPFDLVYLDIRMPGLSGLETLRAIHAKYADLPVVLFTAQPDLNSALEALRQGASDYLLKPLQPEKVIAHAQRIIESREKERRKLRIQSQLEALQSELRELEVDDAARSEPSAKELDNSERFLRCGRLTLDLHARRLVIGEHSASLPPTSFDYLRVLMQHSPDTVDYRTLVAEAQGYEAEFREAQQLAKWHIHQLRQAIETDVHDPILLVNVRGTGYRLVAD